MPFRSADEARAVGRSRRGDPPRFRLARRSQEEAEGNRRQPFRVGLGLARLARRHAVGHRYPRRGHRADDRHHAAARHRRLGTRLLHRPQECPPRLCRSEEHTSELQSLMRISYAVFRLKKKITKATNNSILSLSKELTIN